MNLNIKFYIIEKIASLFRRSRILILRIKGYQIPYTTIIERNCILDRLNPKGIHIGKNCLIASGTVILSHDHCKRVNNLPYMTDTFIGDNCFVGIRAFIMPGVKIGNEVIVGSMSVVTKDVPSNCIVAGNPAKIIKTGITMNERAEWSNWPGSTQNTED